MASGENSSLSDGLPLQSPLSYIDEVDMGNGQESDGEQAPSFEHLMMDYDRAIQQYASYAEDCYDRTMLQSHVTPYVSGPRNDLQEASWLHSIYT